MAVQLEITLKPALFDAEGEKIRQKAQSYFGLQVDSIRTIHVITIDADLSESQLETIRTELFTNPVTQISSFSPIEMDFDWVIWVGLRPGVRDNPGSTAVEAMEDLLHIRLGKDDAVYTSKRYCITSSTLTREQAEVIAGELLANDIIQQTKIFSKKEWDPNKGIGLIIPKVCLEHMPTVSTIPIDSDQTLQGTE